MRMIATLYRQSCVMLTYFKLYVGVDRLVFLLNPTINTLYSSWLRCFLAHNSLQCWSHGVKVRCFRLFTSRVMRTMELDVIKLPAPYLWDLLVYRCLFRCLIAWVPWVRHCRHNIVIKFPFVVVRKMSLVNGSLQVLCLLWLELDFGCHLSHRAKF